ncbi:MAG: hypothetical protein V4691_07085 [Pseudomonadota bacterium]
MSMHIGSLNEKAKINYGSSVFKNSLISNFADQADYEALLQEATSSEYLKRFELALANKTSWTGWSQQKPEKIEFEYGLRENRRELILHLNATGYNASGTPTGKSVPYAFYVMRNPRGDLSHLVPVHSGQDGMKTIGEEYNRPCETCSQTHVLQRQVDGNYK